MLASSNCLARPARALSALVLTLLASLLSVAAPGAENAFRDPLDMPAQMRSQPEKRSLMAIAFAGERLVAVGLRGLIVVSDDGGTRWTQATVPVQSDLLAVHFPLPSEGWAVGHDGVVLHSADGGLHWVKQFDGRMALDVFRAHYARSPDDEAAGLAAEQVEVNYRGGPSLPWLDVWFEDGQRGYVVGSFGMLMSTRDGGRHWEPWLERIDNSEYLNLNAVRGIGGEIYIAGERGQVFKLDRASGRFVRTDTGYNGSFFGIVGAGETLLAYGLRGALYRSADGGAGWSRIEVPSEQTFTAAAPRDSGAWLGNVAGQLFEADWKGDTLRASRTAWQVRLTGLAALKDGGLVATGLEGVSLDRPAPSTAAPR